LTAFDNRFQTISAAASGSPEIGPTSGSMMAAPRCALGLGAGLIVSIASCRMSGSSTG
jgi:hypothetical protein